MTAPDGEAWPAPGERVVWLRRGVVTARERRTSAGERFVVVDPHGWAGEPAWILARGVAEQLRPLVARDVAERWLRELEAPTTPRLPGTAWQREQRARLAVELGTPDQQVEVLAHAYAEPGAPRPEDLDAIERLERLVVVELACVLGLELEPLRARLRARPRFAPGAPRTADDEPPPAPPLPPGHAHLSTFPVERSIHVTDQDGLSLRLPARRGPWYGVAFEHVDADGEPRVGLVAIAASHVDRLPLALPDEPVAAASDGRGLDPVIVGDDALADPLVEAEVREAVSETARHRGVVRFERGAPLVVRTLENGGEVVAVEVRPIPEEDLDELEVLVWPRVGDRLIRVGAGPVTVIRIDGLDDEARIQVAPLGWDGPVEVIRETESRRALREPAPPETAAAWLRALDAPAPPSAPRGQRLARTREAAARGGADDWVAALAAAHAEPHRPEPDELAVIERLEHLVLGEAAASLGEPVEVIRARHRARWPRFAPGAPAVADVADPFAAPALPAGHAWVTSFDVDGAVAVTDLGATSLRRDARRGRWHAAWCDVGEARALLAVAEAARATLPLPDDGWRTLAEVGGPRDHPLGIMDSRATQHAQVVALLLDGSSADLAAHGVAWLATHGAVVVDAWERDGETFAIRIVPR